MQLGPAGGFGTVYAGTDKDGRPVAVKRLKLSAGDAAHRELRIASEIAGKQLSQVIPMYDAGEDSESGSYFVVMARADRSLQDEISSRGNLSDTEAAGVLLQIANGLSEVGQLVHRDLKPGNVLLHEGNWKIADFGIARFIEESTSLNTLKDCLSAPYAAPEQWRFEQSSGATDIYALGCIAYALLTGKPPFAGPSTEEFGRQHQHDQPPPLDRVDRRLCSAVGMMLRKSPAARPVLSRTIRLLSEATVPADTGAGFVALASVGASVAQRESEVDARQSVDVSGKQRRDRLADDAKLVLRDLIDDLFARIIRAAPTAIQTVIPLRVRLGEAALRVSFLGDAIALGEFARSQWDVVAGATILIQQANPAYEWSASLWYARMKPADEYRWYEVSYFSNLIGGTSHPRPEFAPFALTHDIHHADEAAAQVVGLYQFAWGPKPIDDENSDEFCNRWASLLAKAAEGQITYPRNLPLPA
ncbi:MAG TPA: serine/threonine-protein kinase [Pirellulales bacterium]